MTIDTYRTADGCSLYRFSMLDTRPFTIMIESQPPYGIRDSSPRATQRRRRGARWEVDPLSRTPRTLDDARAIARAWAESDAAYRHTGTRTTRVGTFDAFRARVGAETDYYSRDGTAVYRFRFVEDAGSWRAYIVRQPSYGGRPEGPHESHRLGHGANRWVCWAPEPTSRAGITEAARLWADGTQLYIATGRFPSPAEVEAGPLSSALERASATGPRGPSARGRVAGWRDRILRAIG